MRVVVLGIGNLLMSDEGVGVHAVRALEEQYVLLNSVKVVDGGTAGMELLPELEGADHLIVVDAIRAGQPPGGVVRLADEDLPALFKTKLSPHQIGLSDLLAALMFSGGAPGRIVLIGVQPASLDLSLDLSPCVAARLDEVVGLVVAELAAVGAPAWRKRVA
jgi:hydrogenase maturation protease